MKRSASLILIAIISLLLALAGCGGGGGGADEATDEQIYTLGGDWTVVGELQGTQCDGGFILPLNADVSITEGNDSTFTVLLEETTPISLKGTRSGNVLSIDTLIWGTDEITDLITGSLTLVSDHDFNGTITVKISDLTSDPVDDCSDVYKVTGTR